MVARGEFRHHAAIVGMHRHLGMQGMAEQPAFGVVERDASFIAGGFDAEDEHEKNWKFFWYFTARAGFFSLPHPNPAPVGRGREFSVKQSLQCCVA